MQRHTQQIRHDVLTPRARISERNVLVAGEPQRYLRPEGALLRALPLGCGGRPGRCATRVEFERFGAEEARAWLAERDGSRAVA
jgi:hypothetical protein